MRMASSHLFQHFFFFPAPTPLPLRPSIHASYSSSIFAGNARSAFLGGCGSVASPSPRFRADKKSWAMESKLIENGSRIKACSRQTSKRFVWSEERTRLLTKYLIDHAGEGKDALFREEILLGAAKAVSLQFQGVCDVASVRRRLRDLKKKWLMIEKLKASSVASWDHATRTITMQEDDYKQWVMALPADVRLLNRTIKDYDELAFMFGGDKSLSANEIQKNKGKSAHSVDSKIANEDVRYLVLKIGELIDAVKSLKPRDFADDLWKAVTACGYNERMSITAFEYFLKNEVEGKIFLVRNPELRKEWLAKFFSSLL